MSPAEATVGRPVHRVEDLPLLLGTGSYGGDVNRPDQLHARVVRSDVPFGHLKGVDVTAALERPGVVRVITAADIPDVRVQIRLFPGPDAEQVLQAPLTGDLVRYVGDPVAVVVAEDPYVAEDAADEVVLDIEPLDALVDMREAAKDGAVAIHPNLGKNVDNAKSILRGVVSQVSEDECSCHTALKDAIVTAPDLVPADVKKDLAPLIGKYMGSV